MDDALKPDTLWLTLDGDYVVSSEPPGDDAMDVATLDDSDKCRLLMLQTNAVLSSLDPNDLPGSAVNWADLRCVAAMTGIDEGGQRMAMVLIEEVSPGETALCDVVARGLAERGYAGVWVVGEW